MQLQLLRYNVSDNYKKKSLFCQLNSSIRAAAISSTAVATANSTIEFYIGAVLFWKNFHFIHEVVCLSEHLFYIKMTIFVNGNQS